MTELTHSYSSIKMFENCPLRYYEQRIKKSVVDPGGEASKHGERIHKSIELKLKGEADLPVDMADYAPLVDAVLRSAEGKTLLVEQELTLTKEMKPTGWWDADAWLRSKLDILVLNNDTAVVADWKTGKRRPDPFQLSLFAAQVFIHYPEIEKVRTTLIWLKDKATDSNVYTRKDSSTVWEDVLGRIRRIEQADEKNVWPAKPSGLCRFCPCQHFCEYA